MKKNKDKTASFGWCGRWSDGELGWFMPRHCGGYNEPIVSDKNAAGETAVRVRVTVEIVKDKNGREIRRKFPRPSPSDQEGV